MRALLLSASAKPGGAERVFTRLAHRLPEHGVETVCVVLQDGPLVGWLEEAGCDARVLPTGRFRRLDETAATIAHVSSIVKRLDCDVVVSSLSKTHVYGSAAATIARVPAVWWQHGIPERSPIERAAARMPTAVVVCVGAASAAAQRRLTPRREVVVIHPGAAIDEIAAARGSGELVRTEQGWNGAPVVGIVGRLEPWKRQDVFLRAAALVAATHPEARFAVIGGAVLGWEASYPDDLRRLAVELGIAERVHFAGHQEQPWAWLDALDIVVHASLDEPFGLVLVEAMALGKPLVATRGTGGSDIVEDGVSGVLVDPDRPQQLAGAIGTVLDDARLRDRLAGGGLLRAPAFGDGVMAKRWTELLTRTVPGGSR